MIKKYHHRANYGNVPDDKVNILKRDFEAETINQSKRIHSVIDYMTPQQ